MITKLIGKYAAKKTIILRRARRQDADDRRNRRNNFGLATGVKHYEALNVYFYS